MGTTSTDAELIELERRYWQAIQDGDAEAAARMTADPCVVAGAQGVAALDHATFKRMMSAGTWKLNAFSLSSPVVRFVTDDVAVVAYKVHEELTAGGEPVSLDAADTSTWVRRDGAWLCVAHTESVAGDPFGRDRARSGPG
jgi:uncharacterized protein (TIGR02246 family)